MNNIHGGYSDINPSACTNLNGGKQIKPADVANYAVSQGKAHNTTVPLATVGGDMCWITATDEYKPYDNAIAYASSKGIKAHFSSPEQWANALYAANESIRAMLGADEFPCECRFLRISG